MKKQPIRAKARQLMTEPIRYATDTLRGIIACVTDKKEPHKAKVHIEANILSFKDNFTIETDVIPPLRFLGVISDR